MPTFLSLPNELKLQIIEDTAPGDIENFVLCCRLIYSLAEKTMRQHKVDKSIYKKLGYHFLWHGFLSPETCDYERLRILSESRHLRLYPTSIQIFNYSILDEDVGGERDSQFIRTEVRRVCDSIFNKLDSPYMDKSEMKTLLDKIVAAEVGAPNCMLLTLLPNVERIYLCEYEHHNSTMLEMISKISRTNEIISPSTPEKLSLVKLDEIHVQFRASGERNESGMLEAFMTLPSLRVVRARDLTGSYTFSNWLYPDQYSNVTDLHFRQCTLAVPDLARLFKHLKALHVFSYDHLSFCEDPTKEYGARALIDELYTHAGKTLVFLNYTTDHGGPHFRGNLSLSQPGTLSKFSALKTLRISGKTMLNEIHIPWQLIKTLPPSVEELEIVDIFTRRIATLMFDGMLSMKQTLLPNLRLVVFDSLIPFDDKAIAAYERVGLVLDQRDSQTNMIQKSGKMWLGGVECQRGWWIDHARYEYGEKLRRNRS